MSMNEPPNDHMLRALLEPQLRKCKALLPVFVNIDGSPGDSELCGLRYFCHAAIREVTRKQCENTRDELLRPAKTSTAAAAPKAGATKAAAKSRRRRP